MFYVKGESDCLVIPPLQLRNLVETQKATRFDRQ